jgi:ParB family chromosome partitioning protein
MSGLRHHTALDVDPRRLVLEVNIRHDADADAALVASIRQHGVLQPIVCEEPEPERFVVLAGHRRTLAAIEAGLAMVPVTVVTNRLEHERVLAQYELAEGEEL